MIVFVCFLCLTFLIYQASKSSLEIKSLLELSSFILGTFSLGIFMLLYASEESLKPNLLYLALIPLFILLLKYLKGSLKSKPIETIANQQRYFKDAKARNIVKFYENRKQTKKNRIEVFVNEENKKLVINNKIRPQFFIDYFSFKPTIVKNIAKLNENAIFKVIFDKVCEFIKELEISVDFEKELKNNEYKAEFFLMSLWENYTYKFNISVANLDILAKNKQENDFLGAIDLLNLNSVKNKGAYIFYAYLEFKDRLKEYVPSLKNADIKEPNQNPSESEFDEEYAKQNDSDKTIYQNDSQKP